jgi:hypothetical protein
VDKPPIDVEEDVTNGYVPKSISKRHALAPYAKILLPSL